MKRKSVILLATGIIIACSGCGSKELDKQTAFKVIKNELAYPRVLDYDVYCSDPAYIRKIINAGLEKENLVVIQHTQKLTDIGKPLIQFTDKAKPYLLPTLEKDKTLNVQKVKLANEDLTAITDIKNSKNGEIATIEYVTAYKDITPFSVLLMPEFKEQKKHKTIFSLQDDGWHIEKKSATELMKLDNKGFY